MNRLTFGILLLVIILLLYKHYKYHALLFNQLNGFWIMEDDYAKKANIEKMIIYIGERSGLVYGKHNCSITLIINKKEVENELFTISYLDMYDSYYKVKSVFESGNNIIPQNTSFIVDIANGFLTIRQNDKIYGVFIKDNKMSNLSIFD